MVKDDNDAPTLGTCLGLLLMLALSPFLALWQGYVASVLWGWFVAEPYSLPSVSAAHAAGLLLLYRLIAVKGTKDDRHWSASLAFGVIAPALVLGVAWVLRHGMAVGWW